MIHKFDDKGKEYVAEDKAHQSAEFLSYSIFCL